MNAMPSLTWCGASAERDEDGEANLDYMFLFLVALLVLPRCQYLFSSPCRLRQLRARGEVSDEILHFNEPNRARSLPSVWYLTLRCSAASPPGLPQVGIR